MVTVLGFGQKRFWQLLAAGAALVCAVPALASDDVLMMQPVSQWSLDNDGESCGLQRKFEGDKKTFILEMRSYSGNLVELQFIVASADMSFPKGRNLSEGMVRFLPDDQAHAIAFAQGMRWGFGAQGISFNATLDLRHILDEVDRTPAELKALNEALPERERAINGIELREVFRRDLRLETGSLGPAMAAMRTCVDGLLAEWGIDLELHKTLSRGAVRQNFGELAAEVSKTYPASARFKKKNGLVRVRLTVSPAGRVASCHIQDEYGGEEFRTAACDIFLEKAEYSPALDAAGNPIASYDILSIYYQTN